MKKKILKKKFYGALLLGSVLLTGGYGILF